MFVGIALVTVRLGVEMLLGSFQELVDQRVTQSLASWVLAE